MGSNKSDGKQPPRKATRGTRSSTKPGAAPRPAAKGSAKATGNTAASRKPANPGANKAAASKAAARTPSKAPAAKGGARGGRRKPGLEGSALALEIARVAIDKKALHVEIVDVRGKVDYADYIVVMSGRSDRQVAALAGYVEQELFEKHRTRCSSVEGLPQSAWVLMDYGDVIVHIFHEDTRGYYDVESLWLDAARLRPEPPRDAPKD